MMKPCLEELEIGDKKFSCHRYDPQHHIHEFTGTSIDTIYGNKIVIKTRFTIQWTVTEMEIE